MNHLLTIIFSLVLSLPLLAQNVSVSDFYLDENDLTANTQGTIVLDQNGDKCALVRVQTTQTGFSFNVGTLGVTKTEYRTGEVWIYLPAGVKRIDIRHPQLGSLIGYNFPVAIERAKTYIMKLTTGTVTTIVEDVGPQSQYVVFKVSPANASIELDNQLLEVKDGTASKLMEFGTYGYRVQAPKYEPEAGNVTVNDNEKKVVVNIDLKKAASNVTFSVESDAEIWIDGVLKGNGRYSEELAYGNYLLETKKDGYLDQKKQITISSADNNQVIDLPEPIPTYATLDINTSPSEAKVYIDDSYFGETPLYLPKTIAGPHTLIFKKSGYKDYTYSVRLKKDATEKINVTLEELVTPKEAKVAKAKESKEYKTRLKELMKNHADYGEMKQNLTLGWATCWCIPGLSWAVLIKGYSMKSKIKKECKAMLDRGY